MKYFKWIVKNGTRKTVVVWVASVTFGVLGFAALTIQWLILVWNYISYRTNPTFMDVLFGCVISTFVLIPCWLGYYFSDRQLFYDEYMKHSENYM